MTAKKKTDNSLLTYISSIQNLFRRGKQTSFFACGQVKGPLSSIAKTDVHTEMWYQKLIEILHAMV